MGGGGRPGKAETRKATKADRGGRAPGAPQEKVPDQGGEPSGGGGARGLVEALRSFSTNKWWEIGSGDGAEAPVRKRTKPEEFQRHCAEKHAEMKKVYDSAMMQDSEQRWLRKVSSEGTAGDRVASLTMLIQLCPVFATGQIKALLGMASKLGRSDSIMAMDGLKDLFIGTLLPDRKLRTLAQMEPVSPKGLSKVAFTEHCVVAFFEDYLKTVFAAFVQIVSEVAHNTVVFFKNKAIRTAYELLVGKPEQERALLGLLVNKFGDLAPKVSSNASFRIKKLVEAHPGMKSIVAREVEAFLARPNITKKSQYFALLYLSEMIYSRRDGELAAQLIRLFVAQLEAALKRPAGLTGSKKKRWRRPRFGGPRSLKRGLVEDDNRLIRTLIQGIQRALPYLDSSTGTSPLQEDTINALFKVCHTVSAFSTRIAIMSLLYKTLFARGAPPDRFYRLLHEQLTQFELFASTHRLQALRLLRQCVPVDASCSRATAMGRRLLQLGSGAEPPLAVAGLSLLGGLLERRGKELRPLLRGIEAEARAAAPNDEVEEAAAKGNAALDPEEERFTDAGAHEGDAAAAAAEAARRYCPSAREPRFARARRAPLWELHALASHVHPTVAQGASQLLAGAGCGDLGDNPFELFSCGELLEQYVSSSRAHRGQQKEGTKARVLFNTEHFSRKKNVPPHERFFKLYFRDATVRELQRSKALRKKDQEEDVDEEGGAQQDEEGAEDEFGEEDEEDRFFQQYIEDQLPKDGDEDDDADDDDDDDDFSEVGEEAEGAASGSGSEQGEAGDASAEDEAERRGAESQRKRSADEANLTRREAKEQRKRSKVGAMFASAEDYEHLLAEDFA